MEFSAVNETYFSRRKGTGLDYRINKCSKIKQAYKDKEMIKIFLHSRKKNQATERLISKT